MTYNDISNSVHKVLEAFASREGFELNELNDSLTFTCDYGDHIWGREVTPELILLIQKTEEENSQEAWDNIDLEDVADGKRWFLL